MKKIIGILAFASRICLAQSPEQPEPSDAAGDTTGEAGAGADINSPDS